MHQVKKKEKKNQTERGRKRLSIVMVWDCDKGNSNRKSALNLSSKNKKSLTRTTGYDGVVAIRKEGVQWWCVCSRVILSRVHSQSCCQTKKSKVNLSRVHYQSFYIMHIIWSWPNLLQCDNCIFVLILHFKGAALCNDSFSLKLQVDHNEYFCATAIFFIAPDCHLHYKYELCGGYFTQLIFTLNIVRNTFSSLS